MNVPIQNVKSDFKINNIEVRTPTPGVLSNTKAVMSSNNIYEAIIVFLAGCTESIELENGKELTELKEIKSFYRHLPYRSSEYLVNEIMVKHYGQDNSGIEGAYECPTCANVIYARKEFDEMGEVVNDTLDYITSLKVNYADKTENTFTHELEQPLVIKDKKTGNIIQDIRSITLYHSTLQMCANAFQRVGGINDSQLQIAIFAESVFAINGQEVDTKWKSEWGMMVFEKMPSLNDFMAISNKSIEYGVENFILKNCPKCGRKFKAPLDTSNFFVSGLQI